MGRIGRPPSIDSSEEDESSNNDDAVSKSGSESESDSGDRNAESKRGGNRNSLQAAASPDRAEVEGTKHQTEGRGQTAKQQWNEARDAIIAELKTPTSEIHLTILTLRTTKKEKCTKIWKRYASEFDEKKVVDSVGRLLLQYSKKEGHFSEKSNKKKTKNDAPIWKTRKVQSEAYTLLYKLRLHSEQGTGIDDMDAETIYKHHKVFHAFDLEDFKKKDIKMVKLTDKHRREINENIELFKNHRLRFPKKSVSSKGKPIWRDHTASDLLKSDTKSGKAEKVKPKQLWESREEYQKFSLEDFTKHVYQEKYRQLAGPYWQKKRNKAALKEHEKRVAVMHREWHHSRWVENVDELADKLDKLDDKV